MTAELGTSGPDPARLQQTVSPGRSERNFEALAGILCSTPPGEPPDLTGIVRMADGY